MSMTKKQAEQEFKEMYSNELKENDIPLKQFLWNTFTDTLHRNGDITDNQVKTWDQPSFVKR